MQTETKKSLVYLTKEIRLNLKDPYNIIPETSYRKQNGETDWKGLGYFRTIEDAVNRIIREKIIPEAGALTLKQYMEHLSKFRKVFLNEVIQYSKLKA